MSDGDSSQASTHNVGQPPPHFYANPAAGYGPQPGYPNQFGPAPMAANLRPHPHGHPRHHNQGPSSPPPAINLPNERAQRQALKLRNKYEQKLKRNNNIAATPAAQQVPPQSPKKDNNNVRKLKDRNQDDVYKETLQEKENPNDQKMEQFAARLADWPPPEVSEVTSRTALITWKSVDIPTNENPAAEARVAYALSVDEKSKENKSKFSYNGKETSCRVTSLLPGTEYVVRLSALVNAAQVKEVVAEFRTEACAPDAPLPPKIINRLKTSLQVKWTAPSDNGSHILHYVLECDDGAGKGNFSQVYTGKGRQFTVKDLKASTCYALRLSAANQVGQSGWSEPLLVSTLGSAPAAPPPPILRDVGVTQLGLGWNRAPADQLYTLQISDPYSGYGFRNAHHGPENEYLCTGLARSTPYKFRLQAQNEDGASRWSDEVTYSTLADRPSPPVRVQVKGKLHATQFRLRWDRPVDDGGSAVTLYFVELDDGEGFRSVWSGPDLECTCDKLRPGTAYRVRVACLSSGGRSDFSESCVVTTEPVQPGTCLPPAVVGKPRSHCLNLRWSPPESDGGAMITQYEVNMFNTDGSSRIAYVGRDLECLVPSLLPGRNYAFQVRASNRVGAGPWSAKLEVTSGAGVPEAGAAPQVTSRSSHSLQLAWEEPGNSGSTITGYRLEMSSKPVPSRSASVSSSMTGSTDDALEEVADLEQMTFNLVYAGPARSCEVKNLQPASLCYFRVQASNSVGVGPFSPLSSATTLASSPAAVSALRCLESTTSSLTISWNAPHNNGSPVTYYNVDTGDRLVATQGPVTSVTLENLKPGSVYRLRVQAVNAMGTGPFSSSLKARTRSLPPNPPRLECVSSGHDVLHLRWGDGKNTDFLQYCLEMQDDPSEEFVALYTGPNQSYKVGKLAENSNYRFRINAASEAGEGEFSPVVSFSTTRALPMPLKAPTISNLNETSCRVTWSACKLPLAAADQILYEVQIRTKDSSPVMTKRVSGTEVAVTVLRPRNEYSARVRAIRLCEGAELVGTYSPSTAFATPHGAHEVRRPSHTKSHASQGSEKVRKELSDWQLKLIFLVGFFLLAFVIIVALIYFGLPKQKL